MLPIVPLQMKQWGVQLEQALSSTSHWPWLNPDSLSTNCALHTVKCFHDQFKNALGWFKFQDIYIYAWNDNVWFKSWCKYYDIMMLVLLIELQTMMWYAAQGERSHFITIIFGVFGDRQTLRLCETRVPNLIAGKRDYFYLNVAIMKSLKLVILSSIVSCTKTPFLMFVSKFHGFCDTCLNHQST